jgi:hypothetical protein
VESHDEPILCRHGLLNMYLAERRKCVAVTDRKRGEAALRLFVFIFRKFILGCEAHLMLRR